MSGLVRFSSSSDTVRFDMYQKIQGIRLKKMSSEPLKMKKSQKFNGAKIPTRKMISPATSRITASNTKRTENLFCSMLAGLRAKVPRQAVRAAGNQMTGKLSTGLLTASNASHFIHSRIEPQPGNRACPHSFSRTDSFDSFHDTSAARDSSSFVLCVKHQLLPPTPIDAKFRSSTSLKVYEWGYGSRLTFNLGSSSAGLALLALFLNIEPTIHSVCKGHKGAAAAAAAEAASHKGELGVMETSSCVALFDQSSRRRSTVST